MRRFEVWAPNRRRVEAVLDGRRYAMRATAGGWWAGDDLDIARGARYGFSLDGGPVRPDPRSASQPDGVLGLSEVVDHGEFAWMDAGWPGLPLAGLVLYELHVGTFSPAGTFEGAIARLPQLVELGVGAVELMPVAEFSGSRGWGYDGVDLFAPHHSYGGPRGLKRFVDACHVAGLAVVLDVVYNHLGPAGNFLPEFGPYFSNRHRTPWGPAPNYDGPQSDEVRRFVIDNAAMWIRDYHVDGLRLDAVQTIVDESPVHILGEIGASVHAAGRGLGRETFVFAESARNDDRIVLEASAGGYGLDAVWSDDWHHSLHAVLTGEHDGYYSRFGSAEQLAEALRRAWVRARPPRGLPVERFVVFAQNHDQVGNRAAGERLGALVSLGRLKIAAALLLTSPFTPLLFQGEEWGASTPFQYFTDHADVSLGRAVSEGRRAEFAAFGWSPRDVPDPQDAATFERSKLDWNEIERPPHDGIRDWYRGLIALRRDLGPPGEVDVECDSARRRIIFKRAGLAVLVNLGDEDWKLEPMPAWRLVMASVDRPDVLPPDGVAVFRLGRRA
jgi:maltooligosyltrehalose trehalohydrolase